MHTELRNHVPKVHIFHDNGKSINYLTFIKWFTNVDEEGETMEQIIHEMQDMTYLSWAKISHSSGAAGSFLKAYEEGTEGKTYYKLSTYDAWKGDYRTRMRQ